MKAFFITCLVLFGSLLGYSHNFSVNENLLQLCEIQDPSLRKKVGNKLYLDPSCVSITPEGMIYLQTEVCGTIPLPFLTHDDSGLHTFLFCVYTCNSCGKQYSSQPTSCDRVINTKTGEKCGSTSFTVEGLLPD